MGIFVGGLTAVRKNKAKMKGWEISVAFWKQSKIIWGVIVGWEFYGCVAAAEGSKDRTSTN